MEAIYLDNNASTRVEERVLEAMLPYFREAYGNPSSQHGPGERAAAAVASARKQVTALMGAASPREIVFTSGGTEGNNTAIHAALQVGRARGTTHVLTTTVEHSAVHVPLERAAEQGWTVEHVGVRADGTLELERLLSRLGEIGERCALVSVMWANNETGVVNGAQVLARIATACEDVGATLHVDGVQAPGKLPMDVTAMGAHLVSISGHKFHGPKGTGALFVKSGCAAEAALPLIGGGPQEGERRGGTLNVPGIVGLGQAAALAREHAGDETACSRVRELRERLESELEANIEGCAIQGRAAERLANTASLSFRGVDGELFFQALASEGVAVSRGAACSSDRKAPSHVLLAMGLDEAGAGSTLRFSLSRFTTEAEVERTLELVTRLHGELAALGALGG